MIRGTSKTRGVINVACALALALACAPTRARAQPPSPQTNPTGASRFAADPHGVVETSPPVVISLPVVLAPVPDLDRDDETGVAARARLREAHVPGDFNVADRRGPPARGSPDETAKSDAAAFFFRERDEREKYSTSGDAASNCHSNEHCADAVYGQPTIGHGSPLPYPKVVRGVHAPRCLRDRPPTCTCFGPFTFVRPWGYYCVLVPSKDDPNGPPPPIDAPSPPPIDAAPSPPPSPPVSAQCGDPPVGFTCDVSPDGVDPCGANGLGLCVFVDGVRSCCCDAECDTVFNDCCADKRSCCDERKTERRFGERRERTSAARIEARARRG